MKQHTNEQVDAALAIVDRNADVAPWREVAKTLAAAVRALRDEKADLQNRLVQAGGLFRMLSVQAEPGSVVQLDPAHSDWGPLLCVVDTVHAWGIQCYALHAETRGAPPAQMWLRVQRGHYVVIGSAGWALQEQQQQDE